MAEKAKKESKKSKSAAAKTPKKEAAKSKPKADATKVTKAKATKTKNVKLSVPTMEELLDAGVHFGHQVRRWNPKMEPYIFAQRMGIHVIDLEVTEKLLKDACEFLYSIAAEGGQIVFVGTKRQAAEIIKLEADRAGAMFVTERWLGGTITNYRVIKKNIDKLVNLRKRRAAGELEKYTKKEQLLIDREIEKLDRIVGGILNLKGKPAALFVVDAKREKTAIREAKIAGVPVIALLDTNSNPEGIDYVIPGNDDAIRSIVLVVKAISDAIEMGYKQFADTEKKSSASSKSADQKNQKEDEAEVKEPDSEQTKASDVVVTETESAHATAVDTENIVEAEEESAEE